MTWADPGKESNVRTGIQTRIVDLQKTSKIRARNRGGVFYSWSREPTCKILGFTHYKSVDPQNCPSVVVRPVP